MSNPRGLILDAGILQGLNREKAPNTPLADWLGAEQRKGLRLLTIKEVIAECIDVPVTLLTKLNVSVEQSKTPPDPQGLLHAFSQGSRSVSFHEDLPRADRAVVAHAIAGQYDIVTTDQRMKQRSFKEFLKRLERTSDQKLPPWRIPQIHVAQRGLWH